MEHFWDKIIDGAFSQLIGRDIFWIGVIGGLVWLLRQARADHQKDRDTFKVEAEARTMAFNSLATSQQAMAVTLEAVREILRTIAMSRPRSR